MNFVQADELMIQMKEQNLFLSRIAIALEAIVAAKQNENFNKMYSKMNIEDLAGR